MSKTSKNAGARKNATSKGAKAPKTSKAPEVKTEAPAVVAPAPVVTETAPAAPAVVRDLGGNRLVTRAHAINAVLVAAKDAMSAADIERAVHASELGREYAKRNNKQVGAIRNHLVALVRARLIVNEGGKFKWRANDDGALVNKAQANAEIVAALKAQEQK